MTVLAIARNQSALPALPTDPACPIHACDGVLKPRFRNESPFPMFWGCSRYHQAAASVAFSDARVRHEFHLEQRLP